MELVVVDQVAGLRAEATNRFMAGDGVYMTSQVPGRAMDFETGYRGRPSEMPVKAPHRKLLFLLSMTTEVPKPKWDTTTTRLGIHRQYLVAT
jgi:hypothetical protein